MKVGSSHRYAASPDAVLTMMTSPDVLSDKYRSLGHKDVEILEHTVSKGAITVRSRRSVPMEVPGFARRFLRPMNSVEQRDHWDPVGADGVRTGTWEVRASGVPVSAGGTLRLCADGGDQTHVEITGEVKSSIPLVGGKLADFVGADVQRTLHAEAEFNAGHLAAAARPRKRGAPRG